MRRLVQTCLACIVLAGVSLSVQAQGMLMARSELKFDNSMQRLKTSIVEHGYTVAHVQRCDGGLQGFGYETDSYHVVFFGKLEEVRELSREHPELVPFLPLKFALFAEGNQTIVTAINPRQLGELFPDAQLQIQFNRWENDLRSILAEVKAVEKPDESTDLQVSFSGRAFRILCHGFCSTLISS